MQSKLLRVLENGEYQRVGETASRVSRARIVAASNRDLRQAVRQGAFRPDLYHRLSVFTLGVPPLRELEGDKLLLLEHYRRFYAEQSACGILAGRRAVPWLAIRFRQRAQLQYLIRLTCIPARLAAADRARVRPGFERARRATRRGRRDPPSGASPRAQPRHEARPVSVAGARLHRGGAR
jgi:sigma54-dependent transcription regulator